MVIPEHLFEAVRKIQDTILICPPVISQFAAVGALKEGSAYCREQLPFAKAPKVVVFGNDIPVTSTGKYQRNKCKPLFIEWKGVQFRKH